MSFGDVGQDKRRMTVKAYNFDEALTKDVVKNIGRCKISVSAAFVFWNAYVVMPKVVPLGKLYFLQPLWVVCRYAIAGFVPSGQTGQSVLLDE